MIRDLFKRSKPFSQNSSSDSQKENKKQWKIFCNSFVFSKDHEKVLEKSKSLNSIFFWSPWNHFLEECQFFIRWGSKDFSLYKDSNKVQELIERISYQNSFGAKIHLMFLFLEFQFKK